MINRLLALTLLALPAVSLPDSSNAGPVRVRFEEGYVHAFLKLSRLDGATLAAGDLAQESHGQRVTSRLIFRFKDGSIHDESTVFDQQGVFRYISGRLAQMGPAFPRAIDMSIDGVNGRVTVRYMDANGESKTSEDQRQVPPDLANGLVPILLKNVDRAAVHTWPMVVATPKPRLVKLQVADVGQERLTISGSARKAIHYVVKVDIGGIAGILAPLVGKQPPDSHVWILDTEAPAFVKSEGPLFYGGPTWRIELASPLWPSSGASAAAGRRPFR